MPSFLKKLLLTAALALWVAVVAGGMGWMTDYSFTPGESGDPAVSWPAAEIQRGAGRFTLVLGLHPECPCSRATLGELERLLTEAGEALEALVVFDDTRPGLSARNSALYQHAARLPRTRVAAVSAAGLRRFDFRTSGETRLHRPDGTLVFRGGITASRGHEGANPGSAAVVRHVRAELCDTTVTPPFGCALASAQEASP